LFLLLLLFFLFAPFKGLLLSGFFETTFFRSSCKLGCISLEYLSNTFDSASFPFSSRNPAGSIQNDKILSVLPIKKKKMEQL